MGTYLIRIKERYSFSSVTDAPGPPDSMHILIYALWKVVIDHYVNIFDV